MVKREGFDLGEVLTGAALLLGVGWLVSRSRAGDTSRTYCEMARTGRRTLSDGAVAVIVSQVREALYGGLMWEDEQGAIDALARCRTDADLYAVACLFGTWAPITQTDRDLFQAVRAFFDGSDIVELNRRLSSVGITVLF
jgi:hypothetical protein